MDAMAVLYMAKWVMAELIRLLHNTSTEEATDVVEALVERETPMVWEVGDVKRVLDTALGRKDQTLLLLHASSGPLNESDLAGWVEHPRIGYYRRDVLRPLHKAKLIEYAEEDRLVHLSPLGVRYVEE